MKSFIFIQLKYSLKNKKSLQLILGIILILVVYILKLKYYSSQYELNVNLKDYIIFSIGGWENPIVITYLIDWIFLVFLSICVCFSISNNFDEIDTYIFNRVGYKSKVWFYTCLNQLLITLFFTIFIFVIALLFGWLAFGSELISSEYAKEFYKELVKIDFITLLIYIFFIFFTGIYAIQMIIKALSNILYYKYNFYIIFFMVYAISGVLFLFFGFPKFISPIFWLSIIKFDYRYIFYNIIIGLLSYLIGNIIYILKEI